MASNTDIMDLTTQPQDHLTSLPPEIQQIIIGYLFPTHEPDKAFESGTIGSDRDGLFCHPLDYLAATCKVLRGEVMEWSFRFLSQHPVITKYKTLKTTRLQARRNLLRGRGGLLTWAEKHCVFCGKATSRSAILMNGLRCCTACDKEQWPEKITKTDAKKRI